MGKCYYIFLIAVLALTGCSTTLSNQPSDNALTAVGYASISLQSGSTFQQQTLQAITASKLAAYRELTEQLFGQEISGSTSLSQMLVQNDTLRGRVDGLVRGAEVVASYPQGDTYVTELRLDLDRLAMIVEKHREITTTDVPVIRVPTDF